MARLTDIPFPAALLARAAAGGRDAQAEIYRAVAGPAFALARRLVGDRAAAEDIFQDSLMIVFRELPAFRGEAPFGAWVRRIVVSRCLMHLRSPWQRLRLALLDAGDDDDAPRHAARLAASAADGAPAPDLPLALDLDRALAGLAPTARAVLWLHDVEGLTHDEIAAAFGQTASFSKSQLSRAHRALRPLLDAPEKERCRTQLRPAT